jgi:hypothetical protein
VFNKTPSRNIATINHITERKPMNIPELKAAVTSVSKKITGHVLKIQALLVDIQTHADNGEYEPMVALLDVAKTYLTYLFKLADMLYYLINELDEALEKLQNDEDAKILTEFTEQARRDLENRRLEREQIEQAIAELEKLAPIPSPQPGMKR